MRVLITGGYGCIGAWVVRRLLDRGDDVCVFDVRQDLHRLRLLLDDDELPQVPFLPGDVTDLDAVSRAIGEQGATQVLHLAGLQVPTCRADPILGAKVNVVGTLVVLEAVRSAGPRVRRLVYASSAAVYGPDGGINPATHYGVFKCCNEGNARVYYQDHGVSSAGVRPWTVYGVGRDFGMTSEPTMAIEAVARGQRFAISYGGRQDFQLARDCADEIIRCLETPVEGARVYNLPGVVADMAEFHRALCRVEPAAERLVTFGEQPLVIPSGLDSSEFTADFGGVAVTPIEVGIRDTLEQFRRLHASGKLCPAD
jgi:nucleoside-diphosphate-sugar epimerase